MLLKDRLAHTDKLLRLYGGAYQIGINDSLSDVRRASQHDDSSFFVVRVNSIGEIIGITIRNTWADFRDFTSYETRKLTVLETKYADKFTYEGIYVVRKDV